MDIIYGTPQVDPDDIIAKIDGMPNPEAILDRYIQALGGAERLAALKSFEENVSKEEAKAKAFDQLATSGTDAGLEAEFAALGGQTVDNELAALKAARQTKALPAAPMKQLSAPEV